jgi:AraC-like DNA-binding protein
VERQCVFAFRAIFLQFTPIGRLSEHRMLHRDTRDSVRVAALAGIPELIARLGGDARRMFRAHGFDSTAIDDPERHVSYADFIRLLESCADELRCPDFGLRVAALQDISVLGPVAAVIRHSPNVADAVSAVARYLRFHTPGAAVELIAKPGQMPGFTVEIVLPDVRSLPQINELSMFLGQRLLQLLLAEDYRAAVVHFVHESPRDTAPLRRVFGPKLEFSMPINRFVLRKGELTRTVKQADPALLRLISSYIEFARQDATVPLVERTSRAMRTLVPSGRCSLATVSDHLGIAPRSLQRKLKEHGTSFRELLERQQRQIAERLLANPGLPLLRVASMSGFSEQSAFNRAFARWTGQPPGRWRLARSH